MNDEVVFDVNLTFVFRDGEAEGVEWPADAHDYVESPEFWESVAAFAESIARGKRYGPPRPGDVVF